MVLREVQYVWPAKAGKDIFERVFPSWETRSMKYWHISYYTCSWPRIWNNNVRLHIYFFFFFFTFLQIDKVSLLSIVSDRINLLYYHYKLTCYLKSHSELISSFARGTEFSHPLAYSIAASLNETYHNSKTKERV